MLISTFVDIVVLEGGVVAFPMTDGDKTVTVHVTQEAIQNVESAVRSKLENFSLGTDPRERLEAIANQKYATKSADEDVKTIRITSADVR